MKLLIIEDNKEILNSLQTNLEEECFVVDTSEDGEEGSFLARTNNYDLIILDIMLPHKNGYQVCEEIRSAGKNTPIIILSVESELQNKVDLLNLGADDYLTKPFALSELLARINAILRRPKEIENDILQLGVLTMDTKRHTVNKDKKGCNITLGGFKSGIFVAK
ncbi:response regulator transcription factor [Patescibacteria group bacterium]|nr:response regulator transcription factor [Patescibacteria group bacterium]